jgi:GH15 family glucan-1,4-alpha-glucosidase
VRLGGAAFMAEELNVDIPLANLWKKEAEKIKGNIVEKLWNEDDKRFLRGVRTRLNWWNCETVSIS